jgi:hypothetical protein
MGPTRRCVIALVAIGLVLSMIGPAGARTLRIRYDGDDVDGRADIRRVVSDLSTSTAYLRIDTWPRFHWFDRAYFVVRFDSSGDRDWDRLLEIYSGGHRRYVCLLEVSDASGEPGAVVGQRRAHRPTERSVACALPRSWFPRIQRAVRFYVKSLESHVDRAPDDRGTYHWL